MCTTRSATGPERCRLWLARCGGRAGNDESDIVDAAKDYAEGTLGHGLTAAQWNSCGTDSGALSTVAAGANCITYTDRQVRVRIPDQFYDTTFGKVAGVDNVRHGAFAIAGLAPAGFAESSRSG